MGTVSSASTDPSRSSVKNNKQIFDGKALHFIFRVILRPFYKESISQFRPLKKLTQFLELAGAVVKIGLTLNQNHHRQISPIKHCSNL